LESWKFVVVSVESGVTLRVGGADVVEPVIFG
jgi:hypothetical protein